MRTQAKCSLEGHDLRSHGTRYRVMVQVRIVEVGG